MTEQLSIFDLILEAGPVVQAVMGLLVLASLVSWFMIFSAWFFALSAIRRESANFENEFWSGKDLRKIFLEIDSENPNPGGMEQIFVSGFKEFGAQEAENRSRSHHAERSARHARGDGPRGRTAGNASGVFGNGRFSQSIYRLVWNSLGAS